MLALKRNYHKNIWFRCTRSMVKFDSNFSHRMAYCHRWFVIIIVFLHLVSILNNKILSSILIFNNKLIRVSIWPTFFIMEINQLITIIIQLVILLLLVQLSLARLLKKKRNIIWQQNFALSSNYRFPTSIPIYSRCQYKAKKYGQQIY